jgi:two-component sensor histidine kinase
MINRFFQPLRRRLLLLFSLALVVPVAFGISAAIDRYQDAINAARESAQSYAILASNFEASLLLQAQQIADTLIADPGVMAAARGADPANCSAAMAQSIAPYPHFSSAILFAHSGDARCQWDSSHSLANVRDRLWFKEVLSRGAATISSLMVSPTLKEPVISYAVPVTGVGGAPDGVIALGIRLNWLAAAGHEPGLPLDAEVSLLDRNGTLLVSSRHDDSGRNAALPGQSYLALIRDGNLRRFEAPGGDGVKRLYAVNALAGNSLFVLFGMPWQTAAGNLRTDLYIMIATLCLMTLAGMLTAAVAARLLVTRWTHKLTEAAEAMKLGNLTKDTEWHGAPREIHHLADALQAMARKLDQREADLRESIEQKQFMLREIHHRVKNNLQIVTSLLSLYERQMKGQAFAHAFAALQLRIKTLALVHRHLYESDSLREISMVPFMNNLCTLLQDGCGVPARRVQLTAQLQELHISGDRAIPLALLTAEMVMVAFKYGFPDARSGHIEIRLTADEKGAGELSVRDDGVGPVADNPNDPSDRLSNTLIAAFCRQLGGSFDLSGPPGTTRRLSFNLDHSAPAAEITRLVNS